MSAAWKLALPPLALISPASFSPAARIEIENADRAALLAQPAAIAAPMPLAPPVTRTVLSFKPRIVPSTYFDLPASMRVAS